MFKRTLRRFGPDRRGNFTILFSLALLPMIGLMGLAVDLSMAMKTKTALDASTDAAVLAAATEAMQIIETQSTASYDATPVAVTYGQIAGQNVFKANSAMLRTAATPTLTLNLVRQGLLITATGNYSGQSPTVFGRLFSTNNLSVGGKAVSQLTLPKFMNIYIAYDISQSMGIGSTQNDMDLLKSKVVYYYSHNGRTPQSGTDQQSGCVFGCHVYSSGWQASKDMSTEQIAYDTSTQTGSKAAAVLRIDDVRQSILNIIDSATPASGQNPTIAVGLYSMQYNYAAVYDPSTQKPSYAYSSLKTAAGKIDLGANDPGGTGDSDQGTSLSGISQYTTASGDGSSSNSPQNFVFIVTDGVSDVKGNCTYGHCTKAFDPTWCDAFKKQGTTVGVIYTTYLPFPDRPEYTNLVQPFADQIAPNLQKCASPGYYFEATDGADIRAAANALFAQATASGRLTQ